MTATKPGWYPSTTHRYNKQWWDGKHWHESYWPDKRPASAYLPGASRRNISPGGNPSYDIVGEAWHEDAIAAAVGGMPARDHEVEKYVVAELVPEPDNPHDSNAISVRVDSQIVGYVSSEDAPNLLPLVRRFVEANVVPTVSSRIWAVTRFVSSRGRNELKSAIRIDCPAPNTVFPVNQAPTVPHAVIPRGRSVQVTGEQDHYDVLAPFIGLDGWILVTLHPLEVVKARSTSVVLEVRVNGDRVGQLTPGTSASLMPLVQAAKTGGFEAAAAATVQGSKIAAELTLHVLKAEQIPDSWPSVSDGIPTLHKSRDVPRAYINTDPPRIPPEGKGLSRALWVVGIVVALLLAAVPAVGWVLMLLVIAGLVFAHASLRRRPPAGALVAPTT